jgi:hypothetical protein
MNYNDRTFVSIENTANGEVSSKTTFKQTGHFVEEGYLQFLTNTGL